MNTDTGEIARLAELERRNLSPEERAKWVPISDDAASRVMAGEAARLSAEIKKLNKKRRKFREGSTEGKPDVIVAYSPDAAPRPLLILGLSAEHVRRLVDENAPIHKQLGDQGCPVDVLIFAGSTEEQMGEMLAREVGARRTM